jgi:hypothetical protein
MPHTEIKARLTLRNKQEDTGTLQEMNALRNRMNRNG